MMQKSSFLRTPSLIVVHPSGFPANRGKPGKRVLHFPVREKSGNLRKMLQIRETFVAPSSMFYYPDTWRFTNNIIINGFFCSRGV